MTPALAIGAAGSVDPTSVEQRVVEVMVQRIAGTRRSRGRDVLAVEEPLAAGAPARPRTRTRLSDGLVVPASSIHELPDRVRAAQTVFDRTGGLHAAALFTGEGHLLDVREDVGRRNAVDKLIGAQWLAAAVPLSDRLVGAPSSLAADLAGDANMTLLGFVRDGRFNVYTGGQRIRPDVGHRQESNGRWNASGRP